MMDIEKIIENYLRSNLEISIETKWDEDFNETTVKLLLNGNCFSEHTDLNLK